MGRINLLNQIVVISLMVVFSSCTSKNLMKYYYPIHQESEIKVYKYVNPENSKFTEYWKTTTDPIEKTILTESFNSKFDLYNTFQEKITHNEANLIKYVEYEGKSLIKEINAEVKDDKVFSSNKDEQYQYLVQFKNKYGRFTFEKKRQFIDFQEIQIQGKKYKTARFKDNYLINAIDQKDTYKFSQITYYAEGIGMVKYERTLPTGKRILELERILSNKEFEALKNQ